MVVLLSGLGAAGAWLATGSWWALGLLAVGLATDATAVGLSVPHLRARRRAALVRVWVAAHAVGLVLAGAGLSVWLLA